MPNRWGCHLRDQLGMSETAHGIRHGGGAKLNLALVRKRENLPAMPREKAQAVQREPKVRCAGRGRTAL